MIKVLRALTTVYLALAIGQAGFGSAYLGGGDYLLFHNINAFLVVGLGIACVVAGVLYLREGGPWWPTVFAAVLVVVSITQAVLGQTGVRAPHIFLGIMFLCGVTTICSYVWRHKPTAKEAAASDTSTSGTTPRPPTGRGRGGSGAAVPPPAGS